MRRGKMKRMEKRKKKGFLHFNGSTGFQIEHYSHLKFRRESGKILVEGNQEGNWVTCELFILCSQNK